MLLPPMTEQAIQDAVNMICEEGLDRIYCSLTGEAYATIDSTQIETVLRVDAATHYPVSADLLLDQWQLRHWGMSSRPCPAFRLMNDATLAAYLHAGEDTSRALLTYMVSRLMYPLGVSTNTGRWADGERVQFVLAFRRFLDGVDEAAISSLLDALALVDSVKSLTLWQTEKTWRGQYTRKLKSLREADADDWQISDFLTFARELYSDVVKYLADTDKGTLYLEGPQGNRQATAVVSELAKKRVEKDRTFARLNATQGNVKRVKDGKSAIRLEDLYKERVKEGLEPRVPPTVAKAAEDARRALGLKANYSTAKSKTKHANTERGRMNAKVREAFKSIDFSFLKKDN